MPLNTEIHTQHGLLLVGYKFVEL